MQIGTKLESDYTEKEDWQALFEGIDNPIAAIRELGMEFIEFPMRADFEEAGHTALVERNMAEGLLTDLHPYLTGEINPGAFVDEDGNACREFVLRALKLADWTSRRQGQTCVLVFHAASNYTTKELPIANESRAFYLERSQRFFEWVERAVAEMGLDVRPVSEFQLPGNEPFFRIGETFEEVLATVDGAGLGLCWDTGHSYLGTLRKGGAVYPPPAFVERVAHVHLHDVQNGHDHRPIGHDTVPYRDHLRLLKDAGFDGQINFELSPAGIAEVGDYRPVLAECARRVREVWDA